MLVKKWPALEGGPYKFDEFLRSDGRRQRVRGGLSLLGNSYGSSGGFPIHVQGATIAGLIE